MTTELDRCSVPVLSCADAQTLETALFRESEVAEWQAMGQAGVGVARGIEGDYEEIGGFPVNGKILVLAGKGHNGGDALIATRTLLETYATARADVLFCFGDRSLRPLAMRAWHELQHAARGRVRALPAPRTSEWGLPQCEYALCIDGIFGFQFRPPIDDRIAGVINAVNAGNVRFRAAVDLPSADRFRADFTYATGSVKEPVLASENAGRVRFIDLGFFDNAGLAEPQSGDRVITSAILEPLRALRRPRSDKRTYGHVFILGGSRGFPGAVLMCATAAVRSGAGLVTVFAPESLTPSFAARLPEAIWVGWPETPGGSLALEGEHLLRARIERADALVLGPGIGREPESLALVQSIVAASGVPLVIDADALQRDIVSAGAVARVVTPHAGEFKRLASEMGLRAYARDPKLTVVLKGPITRVCNGGPVFHALTGGPVLARGGSGDLLAGIIGTQLAQLPSQPSIAAARAVFWHGAAADQLARSRGQVAVATTELVEYLASALQEN